MSLSARFAADGMLGKLARKLRLYGLDVTYFPDEEDARLLEMSREERRTLLTADRELHGLALRKGASSVLITDSGDVGMVAQLCRETGLELTLDPLKARCPLCNGEVLPTEKQNLTGFVPPSVLARQERLYQCASCLHVYWNGGHWLRLAQFDKRVKEALRR